MDQRQAIETVSAIKTRYEHKLMKLANVTGVGIGFKHIEGRQTGDVALIVNVTQKKPLAELNQKDVIPSEIDGIPVDVQEVGHIRAL